MKWIGQHIYDQLSRFRNDVYLEDVSSGTIASGGNLGLDSNNKIVKQADTGITDLHGAGVDGANNQLLTDDGDGSITSEANLTFDGSTLGITGGTTTNIIDINAQSLTTGKALFIDCHNLESAGKALFIDVDENSTTGIQNSLMHISYARTGDLTGTHANITRGLDISMNDLATNNSNLSTSQLTGVRITLDHANDNALITKQVGVELNLTDADIGTLVGGPTIGVQSQVEDGGFDIVMKSSADGGDYCSIATTTHGATTITTTDDDATAAHFEIAADGNITLDAAGDIALECGGGDLTCDADTVTFESSNADDPAVIIKNTTNDNQAARLQFRKNRTDAAVDNDRVGELDFIGEDASGDQQQYGKIMVQARETSHGVETGSMNLQVAEFDGTIATGLKLEGQNQDGEIDVTIGAGAASTTTIAGTLTMGSTATINNTGEIQVASQPNITTLAGLTSLGAAGATTDIAAGDITMYNAVNNGNPTISIGSSATNRFVIEPIYNSGTQTIDYVNFNTFTTSGTTHDGRYFFYVDEVEIVRFLDSGAFFQGLLQTSGDGAKLQATDTQASSATAGGRLDLRANDGAAMADNHRLGVINFNGAEDASSTVTTGASIEAFCDAAWSSSENGARMVFSTTDGNASTSEVLTLDSDKLATFTGAVTSTGTLTTGGTIELGHATDTTIARDASGVVTIEGNQVVTQQAVTAGSGQFGPFAMRVARRTLTTAEMNSLHTTPIEIIPAQGANLVAIPTHCTVFVDRASTNSGTGDLVFGYDSPASFANAIFYSRRFHNNVTTDMHYEINRYLGKWGTSLTAGVDTVFDVHLTSAASTDCFTSMDVYVTYYVIDRS